MKIEISSEKCVISIINCISNLRRNNIILSSSAAEPSTVNRLVVGSNPTWGVCLLSSEVEHLVYTEAVGGSIPSASIPPRRNMTNDYRKMQRMWKGIDIH